MDMHFLFVNHCENHGHASAGINRHEGADERAVNHERINHGHALVVNQKC
jgi:hypothetical protein